MWNMLKPIMMVVSMMMVTAMTMVLQLMTE